MNPPRSAGDGRQEIQLTAMVPIDLPVLGNLGCRLLVMVLVRLARVKKWVTFVLSLLPRKKSLRVLY